MCRQELRDLQPTLLDAATYAEEAYLVTDQKDIELHNVRDYAVSMPVSVVDRIGLELYNVRDHAVSMLVSVVDSIGLLLLDLSMLVSVVDRIGAAADRFTDAVSLQAKEMVAADVRVASAAEVWVSMHASMCEMCVGGRAGEWVSVYARSRMHVCLGAADRFTGAVSLQAKEMAAADVMVALTDSCTLSLTPSRNTWDTEARTLDKARSLPLPRGTSPSSPPRCTLEGLQVLMTWRAVIGGPPRHIGAAGSF
ncbi:unnamed protein product [Closterium sp. NIES-65]|nr:unnamed protein product [Closterium sp. NIES-65]CAI6010191.1 unnamed protein product [Closterium sp. NIES-65]